MEYDKKSIYISNLHQGTTNRELEDNFKECGKINRITIVRDPITRLSFGYAYMEFENAEAVEKALILNQSLFKGKQIEVERKKKTRPGMRRLRGLDLYSRFGFAAMFMPFRRRPFGFSHM